MDPSKSLLIATSNTGKMAELREMMRDLPVQLAGLNDLKGLAEVPETGRTFEENARLKAAGYALQSGFYSLADDSGLEVTALGGRPGVLSARYGGDGLTFDQKIRKLLAEIDLAGTDDRSARFACSIALAAPDGKILQTTEGICEGTIAIEPRGSQGFGYDPAFIPTGHDRTFGELSAEIKAQISHRARAFSQIMPILRAFLTPST